MQKEISDTHPDKTPVIHIVGKGAIGLLLSQLMTTKASNAVVLCLRNTPTGQVFYYQNKALTAQINVQQVDIRQEQSPAKTISFLIIPTKSYDVLAAFLSVKSRLTKQAVIILCHNGMGSIEEITPHLTESQSLFFLTTNMGAYKPSDNKVMHTGFGPSMLGPVNLAAKKTQQDVFELLASGVPQLSLSQDIKQLLWKKLMINIAINPLSAIHNVNNGQLVQAKYALKIFQLLHEAYLVATREGVLLTFSDSLTSAYTVMTATKDNYSSMNRDLAAGKKTEIEAICGYIVALAKQYNIETPHNLDVMRSISELPSD